MKLKFRKAHIVIAALNAAALTGALTLTLMGNSAARSQSYNYAAQRWKGENKDAYTQISCFFSEDSGFEKSSMKDMKGHIMTKLEEVAVVPEENKTLILDAYSAKVGNYGLACDGVGKAEAEITAVGGDFFFFHDFKLMSGSYFDDEDIMHDGIVLDRKLAWQLYGGEDIIGMNIYINNVKLFVSGVIETPDTDAEERCIGETPKAYISYDAAEMLFDTGSDDEDHEYGFDKPQQTEFNKVSCYECIVPDPVEKFAYNTVNDYLGETYKGKCGIVNNSERFKPSVRKKAFKKIEDYAIKNDTVIYPFWENASRLIDVKLSIYYGIRRYLLFVPIITLIWLAIKVFMMYNRRKYAMKKAIMRRITDKWEKITGRGGKISAKRKDKKAEV